MPKAPTANSRRQTIDRHGQTVDLYNYESDTSERVETWTTTSSSPHSITARVAPRNTPNGSDTVRESGDAEAMFDVYVDGSESGVSNIRDGGGKGASVIDVSQDGVGEAGDDLRVLQNHDPDNGLRHLVCRRID